MFLKPAIPSRHPVWYSHTFLLDGNMPEQRGRQHHLGRVGETLKEEIGAIIEGELADPRISLCHVTEIMLAPDGKSARIFLHVEGDAREQEETIQAVNAAKGYIRRELLQRLGTRHVPDLAFLLDQSEQYGARIDELLGRIRRRRK
jgi:ribosome-binding factor A